MQRPGKSVAMCADPRSCVHSVDLDVLVKIDNKDKFLLNSVLIVSSLFYDK